MLIVLHGDGIANEEQVELASFGHPCTSLDKRPFAVAEIRVRHAPAGRMVARAEPE